MSIIDTLITDRTQADVTKLKSLLSKPKVMWSNEEWSEFLLAKDKGAYNATDLNRLQEAMEYLAERFRGYGYNVPEIKRPSITEVIPGTSKLPEGYTELEYIRSTGTQFFDSGVSVKSTSGFCVEFALLSASGTHGIIGGFTYGGYNNNFAAYEGKWYAQYGNNQTHIFGTTDTNRHIVSQNVTTGAVIFDGETVASGLTFYDNTARTFRLFCYNGGDSYPNFWPGTFSLYSCQIYDNGTLVRDYVPCLNPSNEVGLYDIVNGVFYGNAGSGEFIAGYLPTIDKNTLLLLHGEAIEDASPNTAAIANSGVTVSAAQSVFGGSSLYFNGSSRLDVNIADIGLDLNGDWTIDFWKYATANTNTSAYVCMPNGQRGFVIGSPSGGYNRIFAGDTGGDWTFIPVSDIGVATINAWEHIAVVKKDATIYAFENGVLYATIATSGTITMTDVLTIGYRSTTTNTGGFTGYLDELRISNVARWTSDFTPPDVAYYVNESDVPDTTIERDYWKIGDIPRKAQMDTYLSNLGVIRGINEVLKSTPEIPGDMEGLLHTEANDIEQILIDVDYLLSVMVLNWFYTAEVFCGEV